MLLTTGILNFNWLRGDRKREGEKKTWLYSKTKTKKQTVRSLQEPKFSRWCLNFYLFLGSDVVWSQGWWEHFCEAPWDKWYPVTSARLRSFFHNLLRSLLALLLSVSLQRNTILGRSLAVWELPEININFTKVCWVDELLYNTFTQISCKKDRQLASASVLNRQISDWKPVQKNIILYFYKDDFSMHFNQPSYPQPCSF